MTNYTNLSIRVATALAGGVAVVGGLLAATPALAYYGAMPVYNSPSQVCSGRFDANCMSKEVNYLNATSYQYQSPYQAPAQNIYPQTYNYGYTAPSYSYNTPSYNYNTNPYQYSYNTPSYSYQYQYQYSYQYQTPANNYNSYNYGSPSYNYGYQY